MIISPCNKCDFNFIHKMFREYIHTHFCLLEFLWCYAWSVRHLVYCTSVIKLPHLHIRFMEMHQESLFLCHTRLHNNISNILWNKHNSYSAVICLNCLRIILLCLIYSYTQSIISISIICKKCTIEYLCKMFICFLYKICIIDNLINLHSISSNIEISLIIRASNKCSYIGNRCFARYHL